MATPVFPTPVGPKIPITCAGEVTATIR
jgi:hypothetical protein